MKIDGYRLLHSQDARPLKMQTYVATFATDEEEDSQEIFGVRSPTSRRGPTRSKASQASYRAS